MIAAVYNRVSTDKQQQEGLSLQTQREACIRYAQEHGYDVREKYILDEVFSGLTLNRPNLNKLFSWVKSGEVQAVVIYSSDRFSRDGYDLLTLMRDCDIHGAKLLCVTEDLGKGKMGELVNFVRGWASGLEAQQIKERTARGKKAKAEQGHIVGGFGCYGGYFGLRYEPATKAFSHIPGQIDIVKEVLERYAGGESCLSITKDLQSRGVHGPSGKLVHLSTISRILSHSHIYSGVIDWNGIEITGKVEPIISEELANIVDRRRQLNKQHSYGFGRRKWLSGRVFCGVCGRRYIIHKYGCRCNGASDHRAVKCNSPRVPYRLLERLLAKALLFAYADEEAVLARSTEVYHNWHQEMSGLDDRLQRLKHELEIFTDRRRRLSIQHEMGLLTDGEFSERAKAVKSQENEALEAIADIQRFKTDRPMPPDPEQVRKALDWIKKVGEMEPYLALLGTDPERHKIGDQLADVLDFKATILPSDEERFKIEARVNLPLEPITLEEDSPRVMVFTSSC